MIYSLLSFSCSHRFSNLQLRLEWHFKVYDCPWQVKRKIFRPCFTYELNVALVLSQNFYFFSINSLYQVVDVLTTQTHTSANWTNLNDFIFAWKKYSKIFSIEISFELMNTKMQQKCKFNFRRDFNQLNDLFLFHKSR